LDLKYSALIIGIVKKYFPSVQAIYLFGSFDTPYASLESDVDIALLLPHQLSKENDSPHWSQCKEDLETGLSKMVDLINLRAVSTVFQNEIISTARYLLNADHSAVNEFEGLTLSFYQKLNEERRFILEEIKKTGRILSL
jgi:predicted nucleotidyltransferase